MEFNLDFGILEDPTDLALATETLRLFVGRETEFVGNLYGREVPARITIHNATISRVALVHAKPSNPDLDAGEPTDKYTMETTIRRIKMDLLVAGDDGKMIPIQQALYEYGKANGLKLEYDQFVDRLIHSYRMPFSTPETERSEWFMTTRHPGANPAAYEAASKILQAEGATTEDRNPTEGQQRAMVWRKTTRFPTGTAEGLPLRGFEVGRISREFTPEASQTSMAPGGFQDFVDAISTMFGVKTALFIARRQRKAELEGKTPEQAEEIQAHIDQLNQTLRQLNGANLGGVRQQLTYEGDSYDLEAVPDRYSTDTVPVGRIQGGVEGESEWTMDFWKRNTDVSTPAAEAPEETITTTEEVPDPFE